MGSAWAHLLPADDLGLPLDRALDFEPALPDLRLIKLLHPASCIHSVLCAAFTSCSQRLLVICRGFTCLSCCCCGCFLAWGEAQALQGDFKRQAIDGSQINIYALLLSVQIHNLGVLSSYMLANVAYPSGQTIGATCNIAAWCLG